ncbi:hypothetical protein [Anianabacter salinae]|uniref:hypothetical protein n=1 Tax=Anianabacter salinae TaxID=2851023 RepID=UPI00225E4C67|nr:hypothetical protein [Anianabacter salinae]MBV0914061.1 hypothetical protein [Anianabacter salinae]
MSIRIAALAACLGVFVTPLSAQSEFGGEFVLGYSFDAGNASRNKREIGVAGEFRAQGFGGQADYTNYRLGGTGTSADGYGLHLNFSPSLGTAVGGFYAHDTGTTFGSISYYGAEAQIGVAQGSVETHIGIAQFGAGNGTLYGLRGDYATPQGVNVYATADHVGLTGAYVNRFGIGGGVTLADRFDLSAEIGSASVNSGGATTSSAYIGLQGSVTFGAGKGATFERRGLLNRLPGF